jgi:hypothetical protein
MLEFKPEDEIRFPHNQTTEAIIGSAFEVYNHLGYGFCIVYTNGPLKSSWHSAALAETWRREQPFATRM